MNHSFNSSSFLTFSFISAGFLYLLHLLVLLCLHPFPLVQGHHLHHFLRIIHCLVILLVLLPLLFLFLLLLLHFFNVFYVSLLDGFVIFPRHSTIMVIFIRRIRKMK